LLPCPSAIVVMLSAIALHRVAFGLLLILAFSFGLAAVLTALGFALVYASPLSKRLPFIRGLTQRASRMPAAVSFVVRVFPVGSAAAVLGAGLVVLLRGLSQQGFL
jgi:nickel/cobalt exporter